MRPSHCSVAAALMLLLATGACLAADEWTRNDARDEIVENYGAVLPIISKDGSLSYAIDLAPGLDDATLLAPLAPITELILAEDNAAAALEQLKGSESLQALSLDDPPEELLRKAADFKNLRKLWVVGSTEEPITSLGALADAKNLEALGVEGYTFTKDSAETLAKLDKLTHLTLVCDIRGDVLAPLAAAKKLSTLVIDNTAAEPVELKSLPRLVNLQSLGFELGEDQSLTAADFEAIASLPKLERLDLGGTPWKEEDLLKLKASRSLRLVAADSMLDADAATRLTKEFGLIRFVPYGPALNPVEGLKAPKVTALSLEYDETDEDADPPPRDPAKEYLGDGQVAVKAPIESAETITKLLKILSDRDSYINDESHECLTPERGLRLTAGDSTVEIVFCAECHFVAIREVNKGDGLIPRPGDPTRYTHSLSEKSGEALSAIVDELLGK